MNLVSAAIIPGISFFIDMVHRAQDESLIRFTDKCWQVEADRAAKGQIILPPSLSLDLLSFFLLLWYVCAVLVAGQHKYCFRRTVSFMQVKQG